VVGPRKDKAKPVYSLPIPAQPTYIKAALAAGKHVLSEKPIAKDLATAQELVSWYGDSANVDKTKTLWGVAENYRFIRKWLRTAEEVQKLGGVKAFRVSMRCKTSPESKYYRMSPLYTSFITAIGYYGYPRSKEY
jgi:predicted dehydrogenase